MALSLITYLNGISALCVLLGGFYFGIRFIIYYNDLKKNLLPLIAIMAFGMGSFYLGPSTSFISLLLTEQNITGTLYAFLSYTLMPLILLTSLYLGFDIFKPKWKKRIIIIYGITAIVWWTGFVFFKSIMFNPTEPASGELIDIEFVGLGKVLISIYILSVLVLLGGGFLRIRKKIEDPIQHRKTTFLAIGWFLFTVAGILDTYITPEYVVIARIIMIAALILIFQGFTPDKK